MTIVAEAETHQGIRRRIWGWLGFGQPAYPSIEVPDDWSPGELRMLLKAKLTWRGRFRALLSGKVAVAGTVRVRKWPEDWTGKMMLDYLPPDDDLTKP